PEMPFADDGRGVTGILEALRQEPLAGVEAVTGRAGNDNRLQAIAERIAPGHQGGAGGRTHRLNVKLRKLRAAPGQRVDVRRLDVRAAVEADVFPAEVVGDDVDDVGFLVRRLRYDRETCGEQGGGPLKRFVWFLFHGL